MTERIDVADIDMNVATLKVEKAIAYYLSLDNRILAAKGGFTVPEATLAPLHLKKTANHAITYTKAQAIRKREADKKLEYHYSSLSI